MRKHLLLLSCAALLACGSIALAANIPLFSGPTANEPSQTNATENSLIQNIIAGVNGYIAGTYNLQSVNTTGLQGLATTTIPTNTLSVPGQGLRLRCWGVTNGNTNTKAAQLYLGSKTVSTGPFSVANSRWDLNMQVHMYSVSTGSDVIATAATNLAFAVYASQDTVDNFATGLTAGCQAQDNTAENGGITLLGFVVEQIK